ncbi:hypothetical protein FOA52_012789 [Chlamydomonas sp. UWO 241]|nr:hypothetical protein FOA52_012789 [Chlamydomonas sp. UWO 241]
MCCVVTTGINHADAVASPSCGEAGPALYSSYSGGWALRAQAIVWSAAHHIVCVQRCCVFARAAHCSTNKSNKHSADETGQTPLRWAARNGHAGVATLLLDANASVDKADAVCWVLRGAGGALLDGHPRVCQHLKAARPLLRYISHGSAARQRRCACRGGQPRRGCHVQQSGWTPLLWAAASGRASVVTPLLAANASVDMATEFGSTPLIMAASIGHAGVATLLLAAKASVDQEDDAGRTPLSIARTYKRTAVVRLLEEHVAVASAKDKPAREDPISREGLCISCQENEGGVRKCSDCAELFCKDCWKEGPTTADGKPGGCKRCRKRCPDCRADKATEELLRAKGMP